MSAFVTIPPAATGSISVPSSTKHSKRGTGVKSQRDVVVPVEAEPERQDTMEHQPMEQDQIQQPVDDPSAERDIDPPVDVDASEREHRPGQEVEMSPPMISSTNPTRVSETGPIAKDCELLVEKDPFEILHVRLSGQGLSGSTLHPSIVPVGPTSAISPHALLEELRTHVSNHDLFQTLENDPVVIPRLEALLQELDTPKCSEVLSDSSNDFVSDFKLLLGHISKCIRKKRENEVLASQEIERQAILEHTVKASEAPFVAMQAQTNTKMAELSGCEAEITRHERDLEALLLKHQTAQVLRTKLQVILKAREIQKAKMRDEARA